jgi:hypothetical protein
MKSDDFHRRTVMFQKIGSPSLGRSFVLFSVLVMLLTYVLDLLTPLGVPVWLLYFIPLYVAFWSDRYFAIPTVCIVTLLFLAAGFVFSPPGIQTSIALLMRIVFSIIFIGISVVLWRLWRKTVYMQILQDNSGHGLDKNR